MIFQLVKKYTGRDVFIVLSTAFIVSLLFVCCSYQPKPDLKRLFSGSQMVEDQPPVIFLHGVLGSRLRHKETHEEAWFGSTFNLLFGDYDRLALDIDPDTLEVKDSPYEQFALADELVGKDFYGNIIKTLTKFGGYQQAEAGKPVNPKQKNYYVFLYDWRQDNVTTAQKLADFIEQIKIDYNDPALKVDIVAHSMGGLITRYYMRYGKEDVTEDNDFPVNMYGGERVRRVILLGTPNLGSVRMLNGFIGGINLGINTIPTEVLVTMPSLYQLLPHPLNDWIVTATGKPLDRDIFSKRIWKAFKWSIFNPEVRERIAARFETQQQADQYIETLERFFHKRMERARRFVWSLTVPIPKEHPLLIVFGGDCNLTPARIIVEEVEGKSMIRMYPDEITNPEEGIDYESILMEPGDGQVTKASLLARNVLDPGVPRHKYSFFPLDHAILLCEEHGGLTGNINFQDNLLNALLIRD